MRWKNKYTTDLIVVVCDAVRIAIEWTAACSAAHHHTIYNISVYSWSRSTAVYDIATNRGNEMKQKIYIYKETRIKNSKTIFVKYFQ